MMGFKCEVRRHRFNFLIVRSPSEMRC
jgi:hypothetical protein